MFDEIPRTEHVRAVEGRLRAYPAVAVIGPRQIGKTTLARQVGDRYRHAVHRFDLDDHRDLEALLRDPLPVLEGLAGLVVIDEVQRCPGLFQALRILADRRPLPARFLILGSASPDLLRQSSQTLAGRVSYYELRGLSLVESGSAEGRVTVDTLERRWLRGGFPPAYLAPTDGGAFQWLRDFTRTFLERDLGELGFRGSAPHMRTLWTHLGHQHGQTWNSAKVARAVGVSANTARRYLDTLTGALVIRQLRPWFSSVAKRQVRSPKVYVRDTGLLHQLLGIESRRALRRHYRMGASWEGLALEAVVEALGADDDDVSFWGKHGGAELDLRVRLGDRVVGVEFKHTPRPRVTRSIRAAAAELGLDEVLVVYSGSDSYRLGNFVRAVGILTDDLRRHLLAPTPSPGGGSSNLARIRVTSRGAHVEGASVLAIFPNTTHKRAETGAAGDAWLRLPRRDLPMTVFVAAEEFAGSVTRDWIPATGDLEVELGPLPSGGSVVFPLGTGDVPGLSGRLNPILDAMGRTYVYADNIAIEGSPQQPGYFALGDELHLTDSTFVERRVRVLEIIGRASILEHREVI